MAAADHRHSDAAYKNGNSGCLGCRAAHAKAQKAYRARQEKPEAPASGVRPLAQALAESGGPLESALDAELEFIDADPPFRRTLVELARMDARILDHAGEFLKVSEVSTVQNRLLSTLDRIAKSSQGAEKPEFDFSELLRPE